jgi:hypothetical protein
MDSFTQGSEQLAEPLSAYFSVAGDLYSTILPLLLVSKLSLPRRQKWALYGLFSIGLSVVVFGAVRSYYMHRVVNVDWDFTWTLWKIWVWGEFEMWFGIYCASAPALKPFFGRFWDQMTSHNNSRADGGRQVYVVRSDERGGLGKVERIKVVRKQQNQEKSCGSSAATFESSQSSWIQRQRSRVSNSHIVKTVEYDVERCDSNAALNQLPADERSNSGTFEMSTVGKAS